MKLFGLTFFERATVPPVETPLRTDVSPEQISRTNHQIRTFARIKEQFGDLMESASRLQRSYDAGVTTAFNADFKGTYGTANTEIFNDFYKVWARARTLAKDTPQGKAILRTHRNNVVGHDPFKLTMKLGKTVDKPHPKSGQSVKVFESDTDTNQLIEAEWRNQCLPENFTVRGTISALEAYNQMVNETKTIGSILIRLWDNADNESGFAIDLLESDRLQPNYMATSQAGDKFGAGNQIRGSIEYDKMGKPLAYWVLTRHPGEYYIGQNYPGGAAKDFVREQIPAKDIIHFNNLRERAEQEIGFTELDACIQAIWRLFQYQKALTYASISSCMKPFWIKKNYPTGMQYSPEDFSRMVEGFSNGSGLPSSLGGNAPGTVQAQQGIQQRRSADVPGSTLELEYGMELMQTDPKFPIEAAHEFRMDNDKEIAAASAVSYSDLTGDFQSLGYIAAQMSQRPSRDEAMVFQEHMIMVVVSRIFKRWVRSASMKGVLDGLASRQKEIIRAARFRGKRFPFTDELREVQALVLKLDAKLISPQRAQDIMPDGDDIENIIAEWSQWNERCEAYGIPLMDAPTEVVEKESTDASETPEAGSGSEQPPATQKPAKAQGSKTAKMQKGRTSHQRNGHSAALTRQLLAERD